MRKQLSAAGTQLCFRRSAPGHLKKDGIRMNFVEILRIAFRALARNKMRSMLTMLGIIIGVGAVIAMVGIGQGAQKQVQDRIASMGSNLLYVSAGSVNREIGRASCRE